MKKLNELFDCEYDAKIYSIHSDSRYVKRNSLFFCIEGLTVDGHQYIDDAIFQGAIAIVHSKKLPYYRSDIIYLKVDDVKAQLNRVANIFFDYPSTKMKTIGVTGSGGKTTLATLIDQALAHKFKTGYFGSDRLSYDGMDLRQPLATPEVIYLHQHLSRMVSRDVELVAIEVSSIGLVLERYTDIQFDIAVMTSIEPRHLEFHGTFEEYLEAKLSLFSQLEEDCQAILNEDDKYFDKFKRATRANIITYSLTDKSDVYAKNLDLSLKQSKFILCLDGQEIPVVTKLVGRYNLYHLLALGAIMKACQVDTLKIGEIINSLDVVGGRYEVLDLDESFDVVVDHCQELSDYERIFDFARKYVKEKGRIIGVFGPSSYRGKRYREQLGRIADRYLDHAILTNQDERLENSGIEKICLDVQNNLKKATSIIISQRQFAIEQAIEIASPDDIILVLGKGEERFMALEVGTSYYAGDREVVLESIRHVYHDNYEPSNDEFMY